VLHGVRQRLAGDEVGRGLHARRDPLDRRLDVHRDRRAPSEISQRGGESVVEARRPNARGDLTEVADRRADLGDDPIQGRSEDPGLVRERALHAADLHAERDEPLLSAVVESERPRPSSGSVPTISPEESVYVSLAGSQNSNSASGSRSACASTPPISSGARRPSRTSASNASTWRSAS